VGSKRGFEIPSWASPTPGVRGSVWLTRWFLENCQGSKAKSGKSEEDSVIGFPDFRTRTWTLAVIPLAGPMPAQNGPQTLFERVHGVGLDIHQSQGGLSKYAFLFDLRIAV